MERAENTARMLDVNYQTSLLPQSADAALNGWRGLLSISELGGDYARRYGEVSARDVMNFMVQDERNPSSIVSCIGAARENARAVRGTLTTEVWETQNQTWLELRRLLAAGEFQEDPAATFEWVKFRSHLSRGVTAGTMLQDEAFHFLRLGSFPRAGRQHGAPARRQVPRRRGRRGGSSPARRSSRRSTTSITGRRSCARCRRSRSIARRTAT